jgi:hypothetical protein
MEVLESSTMNADGHVYIAIDLNVYNAPAGLAEIYSMFR